MMNREVFRRIAVVLRTIGTIWAIPAFFVSLNWTSEESFVHTLFFFSILGLLPAAILWACAWIIEGAGPVKGEGTE